MATPRVGEEHHPESRHVVVIGAYPLSLLNFRGELIRALVANGHRVTAMAAPAPPGIVAAVERLGARYASYPVERNRMSVRQDLATFHALRRWFRDAAPDVVLAYTIKPVIWGGLAASRLPGVRFFGLITGLGFALEGRGSRRKALTWLVRRLLRLALRRAQGVIFQNEDDRADFVARHLVPESRTHRVWGSGVDCDHFRASPVPPGPPVFLVIARLLRAKGLREFAAAARRVRSRYPEARFRLIGGPDPSPDRVDVTEVEAWQREGVLEYLGAVDDVRPHLEACHVYVLPSYHEGMPRTVLEAMATGRPILTTDVSGCRDTVVSGANGFLVPHGDADALAERMEWFVTHEEEWSRMGAVSRARAEAMFDVRHVNADMLRIMGLASG